MVPILTLLAAVFTTWRATKYYVQKRERERAAAAAKQQGEAVGPPDPPAPSA